jgi:HSP20 family protein
MYFCGRLPALALLEYAVVARIFLERRDLITVDDDLRRVFDQLQEGADLAAPSVECTPPLDVVETAAGIEVVMDLPGVTPEDVTILFVRNTLVITGRKLPGTCEQRGAAFHLAERTFGRFARGVRLAGAFDAGHADATLRAGELRITLPRIAERRGAKLRIAVRAD